MSALIVVITCFMSTILFGMEKTSQKSLIPIKAYDGTVRWHEWEVKKSLLLRDMYEKETTLIVPSCTVAQLNLVQTALNHANFYKYIKKELTNSQRRKFFKAIGPYRYKNISNDEKYNKDDKGKQAERKTPPKIIPRRQIKMLYVPFLIRSSVDYFPEDIQSKIKSYLPPLADEVAPKIITLRTTQEERATAEKSKFYFDRRGYIYIVPSIGFCDKQPLAYSLRRMTYPIDLDDQSWKALAYSPVGENNFYVVTDTDNYPACMYRSIGTSCFVWLHKNEKNLRCQVTLNEPIKNVFFTDDKEYVIGYSGNEVFVVDLTAKDQFEQKPVCFAVNDVEALYYNKKFKQIITVSPNRGVIGIFSLKGELLFVDQLKGTYFSEGCLNSEGTKFFIWNYAHPRKQILVYDLFIKKRHLSIASKLKYFIKKIIKPKDSDSLLLVTLHGMLILRTNIFDKSHVSEEIIAPIKKPYYATHFIYNDLYNVWIVLASIVADKKSAVKRMKSFITKHKGAFLYILDGNTFCPYMKKESLSSYASTGICLSPEQNAVITFFGDGSWVKFNIVNKLLYFLVSYFEQKTTLCSHRGLFEDVYNTIESIDKKEDKVVMQLLNSLPKDIQERFIAWFGHNHQNRKLTILDKKADFKEK